jgi:hypothetical protein
VQTQLSLKQQQVEELQKTIHRYRDHVRNLKDGSDVRLRFFLSVADRR